MKKTISIVGCGTIGSNLATFAEEKLSSFVEKIILFDTDQDMVKTLQGKLKASSIAESLEDAVVGADLIVEAASPKAVPSVVSLAIEKGKDVMVMSTGGLMQNSDLIDKAREKGIRIIVPTGAIAGVDALKAAKIAGLDSVTLTTRKGPKSLVGAPYLEENKINVDDIKEETVIFEGDVHEAVKGFPKNVNVSALLSLAGIGPEKTRVRIISSPEYTKNIHEIEIKGNAGIITIRAENVPSPTNPKTSYLAALAAMASLSEYFDTIRLGT